MSDQNTPPEPESLTHEERLLEIALTEKLGGRKPADVRAQVLAALGPEKTAPTLQPARRNSPHLSWEHYSLLAAVCAGILLTVGLLSLPQEYKNVAWITDEPLKAPQKTTAEAEPAPAAKMAVDNSESMNGRDDGKRPEALLHEQGENTYTGATTIRSDDGRAIRGAVAGSDQSLATGEPAGGAAPGSLPAEQSFNDLGYSSTSRGPGIADSADRLHLNSNADFGTTPALPAAPPVVTPAFGDRGENAARGGGRVLIQEEEKEELRPLQERVQSPLPAAEFKFEGGNRLDGDLLEQGERRNRMADREKGERDSANGAQLEAAAGEPLDRAAQGTGTLNIGGSSGRSRPEPKPSSAAADLPAEAALQDPAPLPAKAPAPAQARPLSAPAAGAPATSTLSGAARHEGQSAAAPLAKEAGRGGEGRASATNEESAAPANKPQASAFGDAADNLEKSKASPARALPADKIAADEQRKDQREDSQQKQLKAAQTAKKADATEGEKANLRSADAKTAENRALESRAGGKRAQDLARKNALHTWKPAKATPNASQLMVGDHDGLPLVGLTTSVQIDGFRARVVSDYYFYNDKARRLEGSFKLRLPNAAALYYFAFGETTYKYEPQLEPLAQANFANSDGKGRAAGANPADIFRLRSDTWVASTVKEARMVPREQAAYAYAEATRRRVDPALVEWSGAGIFQTRVFPLEPGKLHRIVVGYDVNVAHEGEDLVYRFDVPEDHGQCSVDINLAALPGRKAKVKPDQTPFFANNRAFYHFDKMSPNQGLVEVRIEKPGTLGLTGSDGQAGSFFATEITPNLAAAGAGDKNGPAVGSEYGLFLLDTSLSSQPERFNLYLKLLEETLTRNRDHLKHFGLLVFNVETHWWQEKYVENTAENTKAALDYCNTLALEGATDLAAALHEAGHPSWTLAGKLPAADVFLLSDGNATWGELNAHLLSRELATGSVRSLFAYNSGTSGTAVGLLDHLTRETGGSVFAVTSEEEIGKAATAHRERPWQLLSVTVPDGSDVLVAGRPKTLYPHQRLTVVGRGELKAGSEVILHLKRGDEQQALRTPIDLVVATDVAARLYGQVATAQLESLSSLTQDVAVAYARHFRVTGETCSLLMLESEADYLRYNIKPEDDAFVVQSSLAAELLTQKLDELARQLVEPKAAFVAWLGRLERIPGVQFRVSTALKLALEKMPAESFEVATPRLECKDRERAKLPQEYLKQLEQQELNYDAVSRDAERRLAALGPADALKGLSSLIENSPGDMVLTRDVAFSALEWKQGGQAYHLLRRAAMARPYEPQTYLALGRCLTELGRIDLAMLYYETALAGSWDGRFGDFPSIAQVEYLHLLRRIHAHELTCSVPEFAAARFDSLAKASNLMGADLVVIMQWNTDRSDVDLHVTEPSGEVCKYDHPATAAGGRITRDVTQGFGPEMYSLRQAPAGKYTVAINYYGSDANRAQARSKVYVNVYEYFGTDRERVTTKAVTLSENKELREVLQVNVKQ